MTTPAIRIIVNSATSVTITSPYDKRLLAAIKSLPGRRWNASLRIWTVPVSDKLAVFASQWDATVNDPEHLLGDITPAETVLKITTPHRQRRLPAKCAGDPCRCTGAEIWDDQCIGAIARELGFPFGG